MHSEQQCSDAIPQKSKAVDDADSWSGAGPVFSCCISAMSGVNSMSGTANIFVISSQLFNIHPVGNKGDMSICQALVRVFTEWHFLEIIPTR